MKITINNKKYFSFNNFSVQLNLDAVASSFSFIAKFDPDNVDHKELFRPLSFPKIEVFKDDGTLLLTGIIVTHEFNSTSKPDLVKVSGYSTGGILEDVNIPYSAYPLESINRSLKDISVRLMDLFGVQLIIDESVTREVNLIYKKSVASPTDTIKGYLSKLTAQRNIVMTHDNKGRVIYKKINTNGVSKIFFNTSNTTKISLGARGQSMHSEISVIRQPSDENKNLSPVDTIKNNLVGRFSPVVKTLSSGTDTDTSKAADNVLAAEIMNGISVNITAPRWENLLPGDIVDVQSEKAYLYNRTRMIIKSITFSENNTSNTMSLAVVLPESFTGEQPKDIFS